MSEDFPSRQFCGKKKKKKKKRGQVSRIGRWGDRERLRDRDRERRRRDGWGWEEGADLQSTYRCGCLPLGQRNLYLHYVGREEGVGDHTAPPPHPTPTHPSIMAANTFSIHLPIHLIILTIPSAIARLPPLYQIIPANTYNRSAGIRIKMSDPES